jgi:hypothetical protein
MKLMSCFGVPETGAVSIKKPDFDYDFDLETGQGKC